MNTTNQISIYLFFVALLRLIHIPTRFFNSRTQLFKLTSQHLRKQIVVTSKSKISLIPMLIKQPYQHLHVAALDIVPMSCYCCWFGGAL